MSWKFRTRFKDLMGIRGPRMSPLENLFEPHLWYGMLWESFRRACSSITLLQVPDLFLAIVSSGFRNQDLASSQYHIYISIKFNYCTNKWCFCYFLVRKYNNLKKMPNKAATAPAAGKAVLRMHTTLTSIADQPQWCLFQTIWGYLVPRRQGQATISKC